MIARLFKLPDVREVLQRQLEHARRELAAASMERERAIHNERMLRERIDRIQKELGQ